MAFVMPTSGNLGSLAMRASLRDVKISNALLHGKSLFSAAPFYFLVDPAPNGLVLQIPQKLSDVVIRPAVD